jgi:hypothetical protein
VQLIDLFPLCTRDACDLPEPLVVQGGHKHVLKHQREALESPSKFLLMVGGFGGGKTLPAVILGALLSLMVPGNRGIILRRSYPKLHDPTLRMFIEVLERAHVSFRAMEVRDGWPHRLVLPNASEVFARETKDLGRFLGPEYGWFYIDEAGEEPERTFTDLVSRLRLGVAKDYLRGILTTNPPPQTHWIPRVWGDKPGFLNKKQDGTTTLYHTIRVATYQNPFLPESYVSDLKAVYPTTEWHRIIEGHYGFSYEGKPVYCPPFSRDRHVAALPSYPFTIARGWDFGFHNPVVTWHQMVRCRRRGAHWHILREFVPVDLEAEALADEVLRLSAQWFPAHRPQQFVDAGDRAGKQPTDHGPGPIHRLAAAPWNLRIQYHADQMKVEPGVAMIRQAMKDTCPCGLPRLLIHRECHVTLDTFAGGYHYPKEASGKPLVDKPYKDGYYDNVADSIRYAGEAFYRPLLINPAALDEINQDVDGHSVDPHWNEMAPLNG